MEMSFTFCKLISTPSYDLTKFDGPRYILWKEDMLKNVYRLFVCLYLTSHEEL